MEDKMVTHPGHYLKVVNDNREHPECIELLEMLTFNLKGIAAVEVGQLKYLYRFGSKEDAKMSIKEKALQDIRKIGWYADDLDKRTDWTNAHAFYFSYTDNKTPLSVVDTTASLIAEEFAFDKPEKLKEPIRALIHAAYNLNFCGLLSSYVARVRDLIKVAEKMTDEEWEK